MFKCEKNAGYPKFLEKFKHNFNLQKWLILWLRNLVTILDAKEF